MSTPQLLENTRRMEKARKYLRLFLRDTAELNRLIRKQESNDELMDFALEMTIDDWNSTSPFIGQVHIGNYPSIYLLLHGAVIQILKTQGIYQARNELNYSAGGSSFMRFNKSNYYMQWMINFANEYEMKKRNMKIAKNIVGGWGGVNSEYDRIGYCWMFPFLLTIFTSMNSLTGWI
jgi:hypothetical protein